jgi:hypothetical protein
MDIRLREIAGKAAGTYFLVTDNSAVTEIEQTSNLRLFFINVEKGPINTVVVFKKGDTAGLQSIFGKTLRKNEKQGNFSIRECLTALTTSGIAVVNLRVFDDTVDKAGIIGLSPNKVIQEKILTDYTKLFNINGLWTIKPKNIPTILTTENLLNIGNVGHSDVSFFVTVAKSVDTLTSEGDKTLLATSLEIEDFPALDPDSYVKDTFVDVYIFNNTFDPLTVSTNRYYGNLFGPTGLINYDDLDVLAAIPESGFNRKITGSLIPNLKNEFDESISIDVLMNNVYPETNLICNINDDLLELTDIDEMPVLNTKFVNFYNLNTGALIDSGTLLSHRLQDLSSSIKEINLTSIADIDLEEQSSIDFLTYTGGIFPDVEQKNKVFSIYENGIRVGDRIIDTNSTQDVIVTGIQVVESNSAEGLADENSILTYTKVILTLSGPIVGPGYIRVNDILRNGKVLSTSLVSYKPREEQFTNGTAARQSEILDMMLSPGIVKGLKNFNGIRYIVDCFKSHIEGGYKYQFGQLCKTLDASNKFVRAFINEPFIEDLEKSTNPLFKQSPVNVFDLSYLEAGGNPNYSTNFLTKFSSGAEMCFYFGSKLDGNNEIPTASTVSNLFVQKTFAFDVVANATGYLDNVNGLALNPDDDERLYMEKFRWNPIIKMPKGFTIYGNSTGQKTRTALAQIHNSELLAYIKESLYNMSRGEAFKKGTYNEYLATEVEVKSFMDSLALVGAVQPNPIVICNASNNTAEISKQKIKLIHVEYYNIDSLDKVVFDLNLK